MRKRSIVMLGIIIVLVILTITSCMMPGDEPVVVKHPPTKPQNLEPGDAAVLDANTFTARWTQSMDPDGGTVEYRIHFARTAAELNTVPYQGTRQTSLQTTLQEGVWYWRVTAVDSDGQSTKGDIWSFTINAGSLPQPADPAEVPVDPALMASNVEADFFTLTWPEYRDAENPETEILYKIYIYTDAQSMKRKKTSVRDTAPEVQTTRTSHTFTNKTPGTTYFWSINAQSGENKTIVVGSSRLTTGNGNPTAPQLTLPEDDSFNNPLNPMLNWQASTDPDDDPIRYYVYLGTNKDAKVLISPADGIDATSFGPLALREGRTYYWSILAKDDKGGVSESAERSFSTISGGLAYPNNPIPADGNENVDPSAAPTTLSWTHDKDGKTVHYAVYLSKDPDNLMKVANSLTTAEWVVNQILEGNTRYFWQIEAKDMGTGNTILGSTWSFKTTAAGAIEQTDARTTETGKQIELTFNRPMKDPVGKQSLFTVTREASESSARAPVAVKVSSIAYKTGTSNQYVLTLDGTIVYGDVVTVSYTKGTIQSIAGAYLDSYTNRAVINTIPTPNPVQTGAQTNSEGNIIELTYDKAMKDPSGQHNSYTVKRTPTGTTTVDTITATSITLKIGTTNKYILTLNHAVNYGDNVTISYTKGMIQSQDDLFLDSFTDTAVTNLVAYGLPEIESAKMMNDGFTIELTCTHPMRDPSGQQGQFTVLINGVENSAVKVSLDAENNKKLILELEKPVGKDNTITVTYTQGTIMSTDGEKLKGIVNLTVNMADVTLLTVAQGSSWPYTTIQGAIDAATDNDIILVSPGIYIENIDTNGKILTIKSTYERDPTAVGETVIRGNYNGKSAVTISATASAADSRGSSTTIVEGFTILGVGATETADAAAGIHIKTDAIIRNNIIKTNGMKTASLMAHGILIEGASPEIYNNTIESNYTSTGYGAGIKVVAGESSVMSRDISVKPKIYQNLIKNNESLKGSGIYIGSGTQPVNSADVEWRPFNAPSAAPAYVERTTEASANTYTGNRAVTTEGRDIQYEATQTTTGSFSLKQSSKNENELITLSMDFVIGSEFHGGSLTIALPTGFEITSQASVVIGSTSYAAAIYSHTAQSITITNIDLTDGTVTLRLEEQETPSGTTSSMQARNVDYVFSAMGDADGADTLWQQTVLKTATFTALEISRNTDYTSNGKNMQFVRIVEADKAMKVASGTTVETVLDSIQPTSGNQTYRIKNATLENIPGGTPMTAAATLVVQASFGNQQEYPISINDTPFIKLMKSTAAVSWYDTISEAASSADTNSVITVYPGTYNEGVVINEDLTLQTSDPASTTVRDNTVIDTKQATHAVLVKEGKTATISGFTLTTSSDGNVTTDWAAVYVQTTAGVTVQYSKIWKNNYGVFVEGSPAADAKLVTINSNMIEQNKGKLGAGIYIGANRVAKIVSNTIQNNNSSGGTPGSGGITVVEGAGVKNVNDVDWTGGMLPGTTTTAESIEGVAQPNTYSGNQINGNTGVEGADVKYTKTADLTDGDAVIYAFTDEGTAKSVVGLFGDFEPGYIARLYLNEASETAVASGVFVEGQSLSARDVDDNHFFRDGDCIAFEYNELNVGSTYYLTLQATPGKYAACDTYATAAIARLDVPELTTPAHDAVGVATDVMLDWGDVGNVKEYRIYIGTASDSLSLCGTSTVSQKATSLELATQYFWAVGAIDQYGFMTESTVSSFTTQQ